MFILKTTIGDERTVSYMSLILKHATRQKDTYENFRSYATVITQNAVHPEYGDYCCGTCAFFLEKSKGWPSRRGNYDLKPVLGQQYIQVNYSTSPRNVIHSEGNGCKHYTSMQGVSLDELNLVTVPEGDDVEDALEYMESLRPRQQKQARLVRLMLAGYRFEENGYEIAEIAKQTGRHRTTIPKELHGTTERETDDMGNDVVYHQAGAFDVFRAIYTSAIFDLKREELALWIVVDRRDFSSGEVRPSFSSIAKELSITKRRAIERYMNGWDWINKGGRIMPGRKDDKDEEKPEQPRPARRRAKASVM